MTAISTARSSALTGGRPRVDLELDFDLVAFGAHATRLYRARHDFAEDTFHEVVTALAALHFSEIEDILDERAEALALAQDDLEVLPFLLRVAVDASRLQEFGEHAHERERRF